MQKNAPIGLDFGLKDLKNKEKNWGFCDVTMVSRIPVKGKLMHWLQKSVGLAVTPTRSESKKKKKKRNR